MSMTKKARVDAAVRGDAVDRPPVSLWRHFYESEETAAGLAQSMLDWQHTYDWDWLKINPRASYHVEGWGVKLKFSGQPLVKPITLDTPIKTASDWARLKPLPLDSGPLGEQIEAVSMIREGLGQDVYAVETVFNPISIAGDLVGKPDEFINHMRQSPQAVHDTLELITETFCEFSKRILQAGADGLFFATTNWASYDLLTDDEYAEFGRPYDLRVLMAVQDAPFNVLHVCKNNNMLHKLADYPADAVNWAVGSPGNPSLGEALQVTRMCLVGGLINDTIREGSPDAVTHEAEAARRVTGGRRWMLGPACSIAVDTPDAQVRAARAAVDKLA